MPYVTQAEIEKARQVNLLSYLQQAEPDELVPLGSDNYCTREHDSLKISNGKWFWFSRDIGGVSALDYLIKVRNMPLPEAVESITGRSSWRPSFSYVPKPPSQKKLLLPEKNDNAEAVTRYLRGRGIDREIIDACLENDCRIVDMTSLPQIMRAEHIRYRQTARTRRLTPIPWAALTISSRAVR